MECLLYKNKMCIRDSPYTPEEIVTRDFILNQKPDGIINIVDATNIERNLYLTLQLMEMQIPLSLIHIFIQSWAGSCWPPTAILSPGPCGKSTSTRSTSAWTPAPAT